MHVVINEIEKLTDAVKSKYNIPVFRSGDTVRVNVRVTEGSNERTQAFEGLIIGIRRAGSRSAFTIRKISHGEGVERVFPFYSPQIESIEVIRYGIVRRAKLYYMRGRTGKAARIRSRRPISSNRSNIKK